MSEKRNTKKEKEKRITISKKIEKEITKLPNSLQLKIKKAIERCPRFHKGIYEKRARINGIDIYGGAQDVDTCESLFWNDLTNKLNIINEEPTEKDPHNKRLNRSMTFSEFAEIWMNDVFRPTVVPYSFSKEYSRYRKHLLPAFGTKRLSDIKPIDCTLFLNELREKNIERTAESLYSILDRIFRFAVDSELLSKNPMRSIKPIKHEREHGNPLTKEEEKKLLETIKGQKYEAVIVLALYTGLRPCEYMSARFEGDFVVAQNRKQKNQKKIVYKRIPITPMLAPYVELIKKAMAHWETCSKETGVYKFFKTIMPDHKPYDLRTTFSTRCQECKVLEQVVQLFMGHSAKTLLGKVYTKFDDAFLIEEAQKVKY